MADDNTTIPDAPADGGGSPGEPSSLHDDIASAFDTVETRDAPADAPVAAPVPAGAGAQAPGERARGPDGKFIPAPAGAPAPAAKPAAAIAAPAGTNGAKPPIAAPAKPQAAPAEPAAPQARAPISWKPAAREHWAKLPAEVQQEVARRELEVTRTMHESAKAREALTHVQGILGPFAHNISATGKDALGAMQELFQADNTLRHGSVAEKAHMAAAIIKSYGIDITALDSILAGQQVAVDPNAALADRLRREMQQTLQPVMQHFQRIQGARQNAVQQIHAEAGGEVEQFAADGAHEFFDDVRQDMADIIDMFTARGHTITLQDAYERAIRINPQVSELVSRRAEAERVNAAASAAQRARRTAASISGSPAPAGAGPGPAGDSRRAEIEAAWDQSQQG